MGYLKGVMHAHGGRCKGWDFVVELRCVNLVVDVRAEKSVVDVEQHVTYVVV